MSVELFEGSEYAVETQPYTRFATFEFEGQELIGRVIDPNGRSGIERVLRNFTHLEVQRRLYEATIANPNKRLAQLFGCVKDFTTGRWYECYYHIPNSIPLNIALIDPEIRDIIRQHLTTLVDDLLIAVEHLNKFGLVPCDIKPHNILLVLDHDAPYLALIDHKLITIKGSRYATPGFGTRQYGPDELFCVDRKKQGIPIYETTSVFMVCSTLTEILNRLNGSIYKPPVGITGNMSLTTKITLIRHWGKPITRVLQKGMARSERRRYKTIQDFRNNFMPQLTKALVPQ